MADVHIFGVADLILRLHRLFAQNWQNINLHQTNRRRHTHKKITFNDSEFEAKKRA